MALGASFTTAGSSAERVVALVDEHLEELVALQRDIYARLGEIRDVLTELNAKLPTAATGAPQEGMGRSSVEIKSSVRGVDVAAKAYDGSPIGPVGTAAIAEYFRVLADCQRRINGESS